MMTVEELEKALIPETYIGLILSNYTIFIEENEFENVVDFIAKTVTTEERLSTLAVVADVDIEDMRYAVDRVKAVYVKASEKFDPRALKAWDRLIANLGFIGDRKVRLISSEMGVIRGVLERKKEKSQ